MNNKGFILYDSLIAFLMITTVLLFMIKVLQTTDYMVLKTNEKYQTLLLIRESSISGNNLSKDNIVVKINKDNICGVNKYEKICILK